MRMETNFTRAVNALLVANPNVRLIVATVPDLMVLPLVQAVATGNPVAQLLLDAANQQLQRYNTLIRDTAASNSRIALVDLAAITVELRAQAPRGSLRYGGRTIDLTRPGDSVRHFFLADGIHVGTVGQWIIAAGFVQALDARFGARVASLTPRQFVRFASRIQPTTL
jgi:hypothetical protein